MKIFNKFIESKKEPSNKNDIWFDGSVFRIYKEEEWQAFTVNLNDANEIAKLKDELYEFLYDEAKPTVEEAKQAAATIQEYVDKAIDALVLAQQSLANSESAITEATALKSQTEQLIEQGNVVVENANKAVDNANEISSNIKAIWDELFVEINNSIASANEAANNANTAAETIDSKITQKVEPILNLLNTLPFFHLNEDYTKIIKGEAVRTEEFIRDVSGHNYLISYYGDMYYINDGLTIGATIPSTISYVELETSRWYVSNSSFKYDEESNKYESSGFYGFIPVRLLLDGTGSFSDVLFPHSGGHNMVLKTEQELTEEEKAQVKKNLNIKDVEPYDDTAIKEQLTELSTETEVIRTELDSHNELIADLLDMKIDREADDYYPQLAVGLADNLAGVDVVDSEINFRRSGGGAIRDGVARIEAIKGNSVVWNQQLVLTDKTLSSNGVTATIKNGVVTISGQNNGEASSAIPLHSNYNPQTFNGHKMLIVAYGVSNGASWDKYGLYFSPLTGSGDVAFVRTGEHRFFTWETTFENINLLYTIWPNKEHTDCSFQPLLYDLTQMFGAGNEPTTIEEFYAKIPMGVDLNAYNEGEVIHMDVQSIDSVGVNQWDEEWESGAYATDGKPYNDTTRIRTKNPIRVIPNTLYKVTNSKTIGFRFYDSKDVYLGTDTNITILNGEIKTPTNAYYMRFSVVDTPTYNNDICINISDSSINGKYFPYIKRVEDLAVIRKYFPQGMKSAGSAHDEIRYNKATQKWEYSKGKIKSVDMGTLNWVYRNVEGSFNLYVSDSRFYDSQGLLTANYINLGGNQEGRIYSASASLRVTDSSYTDAASFKAAMSGLILYYESNDWEWGELDAEDQFKDLDYQVWNAGTEKAIAEGKSAPLAADITYGFNAIGKIKELEEAIKALQTKVASL